MADNDLRPDVLADLTRPRGLSGDQGDALLDATPAEREAAGRLLLERTKDLLEQAGVLPAQRTVLDLDHQYLVAGSWLVEIPPKAPEG